MREKLKDKQGAALMLALLFLLVATVLSCVVLTAALSAAKVRQDDRARQQAFLDVSSAAQMLKKQLTASSAEESGGAWSIDGPEAVRQILTALVEALPNGEAAYSFCIRSQQPQMGVVDVTVCMDTAYNMTATLQSRDEAHPSKLILQLPAREEAGRYLWQEADAVIGREAGL